MDTFSSLCCPISREPMKDPVMADDNFTYERSEILRWWAECDTNWAPYTSPMTGN